jgi:hypothetical protein
MSDPAGMAAALEAIRQMHKPDHGMGYRNDVGYGGIDPACETCGTTDEYAVPWPCLTLKAVHIGLGLPIPEPIPVSR